MTRIFDWLFVNQLFHTTARGQTVFYPNGQTGRGFLVPPEREADVRSGVRRLALLALAGTFALVVLVPRLIETWWGFTLPLGWFIAGTAVALVVIVAAIIMQLARLTAGLEPVPTRG